MVCSGLPRRNGNRHVTEIADFSLHILEETKQFRIPHKPSEKLRIRIGMHTGERWQCGVLARLVILGGGGLSLFTHTCTMILFMCV